MKEENLYQKLLKVTAEAQKIPKNGYNDYGKYKYIQATDVIAEMQKLLIKHRIDLTISELEHQRQHEGKNFHTTLKCEAKFIDIDNPKDFITCNYYTTSADTLDKDCFKAKTNGIKYLFSQKFLLVTDLTIDTEQEKNKVTKEITNYFTTDKGEKPKEVCSKCGATLATSKEGKKYCSAICWKK